MKTHVLKQNYPNKLLFPHNGPINSQPYFSYIIPFLTNPFLNSTLLIKDSKHTNTPKNYLALLDESVSVLDLDKNIYFSLRV